MGRDERRLRGSPRILTPWGCFDAARADRDAQGRFATIGGDPPNLRELARRLPFRAPLPEGAARMRALDAGRIRLGRRRVARRALLALSAGARHPSRCRSCGWRLEWRRRSSRLQGITHSFRRSGGALVTAVRDVSLEVGQGETVALVGESGSGKSTLGRIALGLLHPDAGRVLIGGKSLGDMSSRELRRERVAFQPIFQDATASLNPRRTVRDLLGQALRQRGAGTTGPASVELLESVGLAAGPELSRALPA